MYSVLSVEVQWRIELMGRTTRRVNVNLGVFGRESRDGTSGLFTASKLHNRDI